MVVTTTETQPKQAVVGSLDTIQSLIREYLNQLAPRDRLESQLRFSHFTIWLRKKIEAETNGDLR